MQPNINKLIGEDKRNKKELSVKVKRMLMKYAIEAQKKEIFFKNYIIEV